jgi:DNA polymerase
MTEDLRSDLASWLGYLKDIGVRELNVRVPEPGSVENAGSSPTPRRSPTTVRTPPPSLGDESVGTPAEAREERPVASPVEGPGDLFRIARAADDAGHDPAVRLEELRSELGDCTRCRLHEGRTHIVFGVGDPRARLMFIGEGPGADEDAQGEPFVGRAGQTLNKMIRSIGLERERVYIANVVKCRPPDNRDPKPDEIATCSPFLVRQIEAIRPGVIVTLGSPASKTLLNTKTGITRLRGTWHSYRGIPVMPTFHPAYLLRAYTEQNRRLVWDDLKAARARMDREP